MMNVKDLIDYSHEQEILIQDMRLQFERLEKKILEQDRVIKRLIQTIEEDGRTIKSFGLQGAN